MHRLYELTLLYVYSIRNVRTLLQRHFIKKGTRRFAFCRKNRHVQRNQIRNHLLLSFLHSAFFFYTVKWNLLAPLMMHQPVKAQFNF